MIEEKRLYYLTILRFEQFLRKRENGTLKWTPKNGAPIAIKDMTDAHIKNVINILEHSSEQEIISSETIFVNNEIANDAF